MPKPERRPNRNRNRSPRRADPQQSQQQQPQLSSLAIPGCGQVLAVRHADGVVHLVIQDAVGTPVAAVNLEVGQPMVALIRPDCSLEFALRRGDDGSPRLAKFDESGQRFEVIYPVDLSSFN